MLGKNGAAANNNSHCIKQAYSDKKPQHLKCHHMSRATAICLPRVIIISKCSGKAVRDDRVHIQIVRHCLIRNLVTSESHAVLRTRQAPALFKVLPASARTRHELTRVRIYRLDEVLVGSIVTANWQDVGHGEASGARGPQRRHVHGKVDISIADQIWHGFKSLAVRVRVEGFWVAAWLLCAAVRVEIGVTESAVVA
jgi:hypothetical protein